MSRLAQLLDEAEARQLPALIDAWESTDDARHWIARALRIDLALAIERPDLVLPMLHRRCVRFGDDAPWFTRAAPPRHASEAAALVEAWLAEWSPGRSWLRAMWPPPVALDAGVIAEYRCTEAGGLAITDDRVGVVAEPGVVWERATGRRIPGATLTLGQSEPTWELERTQGKIVLTSGRRTIELPTGHDEDPNAYQELSPEVGLVRGFDSDGYYWWLIDLPRGRLIQSGEGTPTASAAGRGKTFIALRSAIHIFNRTGRVGSWSCPDVHALAVAPDGSLASRSAQLIRVWTPSEAVAAKVERRHEPLPATTLWSRDGSQLVSAGRLCDARTGKVIATLDVADWSGVIEGSPADNFQGFTEQGFVETSHHGLRVWDRRGQRVVDDPARRAWGPRGVAIDPTGRRYALSTRRHLEVTTLIGGETVLSEWVDMAGEWDEFRFAFTAAGALWWELVNGERWLLGPDSTTPVRTTDDRPSLHLAALDPHEGLLVVGDAALPLDEPVIPAPGRPWYAGRATLIQAVPAVPRIV